MGGGLNILTALVQYTVPALSFMAEVPLNEAFNAIAVGQLTVPERNSWRVTLNKCDRTATVNVW